MAQSSEGNGSHPALVPRSVVLIGFMGAGKSIVGRALARRFGFHLYDTDEMVEEEAGKSVGQIWTEEGESGFRAREYRAVTRACAAPGRVIACGGGAVLPMRSYEVLKTAGPVVYLRTSAEVLRQRVGDGLGRPLLSEPGAFDRLLAERTPAYESAADIVVDTDGLLPEEIAEEIGRQIAERLKQ